MPRIDATMIAMNQSTDDSTRTATDSERRSFLARVAATIVGGIAVVFPFAASWGVLFHPLRSRRGEAEDENESGAAEFVRVCPLESLPADGMPHAFAVTADVADAWTRALNQRIGEVFLTRNGANGHPRVTAFTAECPHLGCSVEFNAAADRFECPCHESAYGKGGERLFGPSRRGLDPLEVKLVDDKGTQEIWVAFQRFRAGVPEREPIA